MSEGQEGQQQQQPAAPPANAAEARAQLDTLRSNADFNAKLLAGSGPETNQWRDLHTMIAAGDNVEIALSGALPDVPDSELKTMAGTAQFLKELGINEGTIRQTLSDYEVTQAEFDAVTAFKAERFRDAEWKKRLLAGDGLAVRELTLSNIVLSSTIKKDAAA